MAVGHAASDGAATAAEIDWDCQWPWLLKGPTGDGGGGHAPPPGHARAGAEAPQEAA